MPRYRIQAPDGRTLVMEGDQPPTLDVIEQAFQSIGVRQPSPKPRRELSEVERMAQQVHDAGPSGSPERVNALAAMRNQLADETFQEAGLGSRMQAGALNTARGTEASGGMLMRLGAVFDELMPSTSMAGPGGAPSPDAQRITTERLSRTAAEKAQAITENPLWKKGKAIEADAEQRFPAMAGSENTFLYGDVASGLGSMGASVASGLFLGPFAVATATGLEAIDAYDQEMERQRKAGEAPDPEKAFAKGLAYGAITIPVEAGLGVGRLVKNVYNRFGSESARKLLNGGVKQFVVDRVKDAGANAAQEGIEQLAQDLIVEGDVDMAKALRSAAAGAVSGTAIGGALDIGVNRLPGAIDAKVQDVSDRINPARGLARELRSAADEAQFNPFLTELDASRGSRQAELTPFEQVIAKGVKQYNESDMWPGSEAQAERIRREQAAAEEERQRNERAAAEREQAAARQRIVDEAVAEQNQLANAMASGREQATQQRVSEQPSPTQPANPVDIPYIARDLVNRMPEGPLRDSFIKQIRNNKVEELARKLNLHVDTSATRLPDAFASREQEIVAMQQADAAAQQQAAPTAPQRTLAPLLGQPASPKPVAQSATAAVVSQPQPPLLEAKGSGPAHGSVPLNPLGVTKAEVGKSRIKVYRGALDLDRSKELGIHFSESMDEAAKFAKRNSGVVYETEIGVERGVPTSDHGKTWDTETVIDDVSTFAKDSTHEESARESGEYEDLIRYLQSNGIDSLFYDNVLESKSSKPARSWIITRPDQILSFRVLDPKSGAVLSEDSIRALGIKIPSGYVRQQDRYVKASTQPLTQNPNVNPSAPATPTQAPSAAPAPQAAQQPSPAPSEARPAPAPAPAAQAPAVTPAKSTRITIDMDNMDDALAAVDKMLSQSPQADATKGPENSPAAPAPTTGAAVSPKRPARKLKSDAPAVAATPAPPKPSGRKLARESMSAEELEKRDREAADKRRRSAITKSSEKFQAKAEEMPERFVTPKQEPQKTVKDEEFRQWGTAKNDQYLISRLLQLGWDYELIDLLSTKEAATIIAGQGQRAPAWEVQKEQVAERRKQIKIRRSGVEMPTEDEVDELEGRKAPPKERKRKLKSDPAAKVEAVPAKPKKAKAKEEPKSKSSTEEYEKRKRELLGDIKPKATVSADASAAVASGTNAATSLARVQTAVDQEANTFQNAGAILVENTGMSKVATTQMTDDGRIVVFYNPHLMSYVSPEGLRFVLKEELNHVAMFAVMAKRYEAAGGKAALGISLTEYVKRETAALAKRLPVGARVAIARAYGTENDSTVFMEYIRALLQQRRYGNITESFVEGLTSDVKALINEIVAYLKELFGITGDPLVAELATEMEGILNVVESGGQIQPTLFEQQGAGDVVASATQGKPKHYIGKAFIDVSNAINPEPPPVPGIVGDSEAAQRSLRSQIESWTPGTRPLGVIGVNLASPDHWVQQRLNTDPIGARIIHALTDQDRVTMRPEKLLSAPWVAHTLKHADLVTKGRIGAGTADGFFIAKLYSQPGGNVWHVVEVNMSGDFVTQYSFQAGSEVRRVAASIVVGVGHRAPKNAQSAQSAASPVGPFGSGAVSIAPSLLSSGQAAAPTGAPSAVSPQSGQQPLDLADNGNEIDSNTGDTGGQVSADATRHFANRAALVAEQSRPGVDAATRNTLETVANVQVSPFDAAVSARITTAVAAPPATAADTTYRRWMTRVSNLIQVSSAPQPLSSITTGEVRDDAAGRIFQQDVYLQELLNRLALHMQQLSGLIARATDPAVINRLTLRLDGTTRAYNDLNDLISTPQYTAAVREALRHIGAHESLFRTGDHVFTVEGPMSGRQYTIDLQPTPQIDLANVTTITDLIREIDTYLSGTGITELRRMSWEMERDRLSAWLLEQVDPINVRPRDFKKYVSFIRTRQGVISPIDGIVGRQAANDLAALDVIVAKLRQEKHHREFGDANHRLLVVAALRSHGMRSTPDAVSIYKEEIINPLLASYQRFGQVTVQVGQRLPLSGHVVTAEDMALARNEYERRQRIRRIVENRINTYGDPIEITDQVGNRRLGTRTVQRRGIATGGMVMARIIPYDSIELAKRWVSNSANARDQIMELAFTHPETFRQMILGYVVETNADFHRNSAFENEFRELTVRLRDGRVNPIHEWSELVQAIADIRGVSPAAIEGPLRAALNVEVRGYMESFATHIVNTQQMEGINPIRKLEMVMHSLNGSILNPRENMLAPSTFYQFDEVDNISRAAYNSTVINIARNRSTESLRRVLESFREVRRDLQLQLDRLQATNPGMTRREAVRAQNNMVEAGQLRYSLVEADRFIERLQREIQEAEKIASDLAHEIISGGRAVASAIGNTFIAPILSAPRSLIRNLAGARALGIHNRMMTTPLASTWFGARPLLSLTWDIAKTLTVNPAAFAARRISPRVSGRLRRVVDHVAALGQDRADVINQNLEAGIRYTADVRNQLSAAVSGGLRGYWQGGIYSADQMPEGFMHGVARLINLIGQPVNMLFGSYSPKAIDDIANIDNTLANRHRFLGIMEFADRVAASRGGVAALDATNRLQRLQPNELGLTTGQMAQLRGELRTVGTLEELYFDYLRRRATFPDAPFIEDQARLNALRMAQAKRENVIIESNAPSTFKTGAFWQMFGTFKNFPANAADTALVPMFGWHISASEARSYRTGLALLMAWAIITIAIGVVATDLSDEADEVITGRSTGSIRLRNMLEDPLSKEGLLYSVKATAAIVPYLNSIVDPVIGGGSSRSPFDLSSHILHLSIARDVWEAGRQAAMTGDVVRPALTLFNRYGGIATAVVNRLPLAEADQASRNTMRVLRSATPLDIEMRSVSGGMARYAPTTRYLRQAETAAYAGNMGAARQALDNASRYYQQQGMSKRDADARVRQQVSARAPMMRVYGRVLVPTERDAVMRRMTGRQREVLQRGERAYSSLLGSLPASQRSSRIASRSVRSL